MTTENMFLLEKNNNKKLLLSLFVLERGVIYKKRNGVVNSISHYSELQSPKKEIYFLFWALCINKGSPTPTKVECYC